MGKYFPGSVSRLRLPEDLERSAVLQLLERQAFRQSSFTVAETERSGWTAGRHLLDFDFARAALDGQEIEGEPIAVALRIDKRRVPAALVRAMLQQEKDRHYDAHGKRMKASDVRDVKLEIEDQLREQSLPQPTSVAAIFDLERRTLLLGSTSDAVIDRVSEFLGVQNQDDRLVTLASLADEGALMRAGPTAWVGEGGAQKDFSSTTWLGVELLLWLWWRCEATTKPVARVGGRDVFVAVDHGVRLQAGSDGESVVVRGESPIRAEEAHVAIRRGKLPTSLSLDLGIGERNYEVTVDGLAWRFSAIKTPKPEVMPEKLPDGRLEPRRPREEGYLMGWELIDALDAIARTFLELRLHRDQEWIATRDAIRAWIQGRPALEPQREAGGAASGASGVGETDASLGYIQAGGVRVEFTRDRVRRGLETVRKVAAELEADDHDQGNELEDDEEELGASSGGAKAPPMESEEISVTGEKERDRVARLDQRFKEIKRAIDEKHATAQVEAAAKRRRAAAPKVKEASR